MTAADPQVLVIDTGRSGRYYWRDVWAYRELFATLAWRDVVVRYRQTIVGVAWAVLRPFLAMVVFTIVFGRLAQLPSAAGAPYPIMVFAGLLPWFLFAAILGDASNSLVGNAGLIGKVYFPRLIVPVAAAVVALVDFAVNLLILLGLMLWYGVTWRWQIALLPIFVTLAVLTALGPGLLFAALNVKYRDFRYVIPFVLQFGLYISPVGFATAIVPPPIRMWYACNPLVGVIDGFRWCILGGSFDLLELVSGLAATAAFLWLGTAYFRRTEQNFADVL
ncbi:MAG TPA: ABC transporter permease [Stellaceae bacterium]|nr:ABC transporter permease [Stellaceae bacterium]